MCKRIISDESPGGDRGITYLQNTSQVANDQSVNRDAYLLLSISCTAAASWIMIRSIVHELSAKSRSAHLGWIYDNSILLCRLSIGLVNNFSDRLGHDG